ncbi:putative domain cysteine-rich [Trinorchestia longiramus]|nr:putative domain cysteine-rich [Trinorchestia longiramus]
MAQHLTQREKPGQHEEQSFLNGVVNCVFRCPKIEGCYRLVTDPQDQCSCKSCQGCTLQNNVTLVHGGLVRDGCHVQQCDSSVITETDEQCHVPCAAPLPPPPGECCPACPGCRMEGRSLLSGETASLSTDPCVTCRCTHSSLVCSKVSCPVLSCPPDKMKKLPGHCCPHCVGHRGPLVNHPRGNCLLGNFEQPNGTTRTYNDSCTVCVCMNSKVTCTRRTCPPLTCPVQYQKFVKDDCCPVCAMPQRSVVCSYRGMAYEHGDTWSRGECATCTCEHGQVTCHANPCPNLSTSCPLGQKLEDDPESCCPRCVPQKGACLAFGMPHYRTFDGLHYDFQGDCKYTLAKDCRRRSKFQLKIINHPHSANSVLPFMRSLILKLHLDGYKMKVTMMVSRKTKVNGSRVHLPYNHRDVLILEKRGHGIQLNTSMGLQLLWDGESYIELVLQPEWQNKTCGLCGNFNGDESDDMTRPGGSREKKPTELTLAEVARSWARGRCSKRERSSLRESPRSREQRLAFCSSPSDAAVQRCASVNASAFNTCHALLPQQPFYQACVEDMCRCSGERQCHCSALMAYARECQRFGVHVPAWRNTTKCGGMECPRGAEYMDCAPACRPTCRNPYPNPDCHTRRCRPGCYCPYPTVLHRGACIPTSQCARLDSKRIKRKYLRSRQRQLAQLSSISRSQGFSRRDRIISRQDIFKQHQILSSSSVP